MPVFPVKQRQGSPAGHDTAAGAPRPAFLVKQRRGDPHAAPTPDRKALRTAAVTAAALRPLIKANLQVAEKGR
jgi:hypothetical protein